MPTAQNATIVLRSHGCGGGGPGRYQSAVGWVGCGVAVAPGAALPGGRWQIGLP